MAKRKETKDNVSEAEIKTDAYLPTAEQQRYVRDAYEALSEMIDVRAKAYPQFNDRSLLQFVDDSEKRLNCYALSKDSYENPKADWQSNSNFPLIRDKFKKILSGFSLFVPDMEICVRDEDNLKNISKSYITKNLVQESFNSTENVVMENFWQAWEMGSKGTVHVYEGYLKTRFPQKKITSYDPITGEVQYKEFDVDVDDRCVSFIIPISEVFIRDFTIFNIQDQPDVIWARMYSKEAFDREFGKFPNAKYVQQGSTIHESDTESFYYKKYWGERTGRTNIEVLRWYDLSRDLYTIVANGVSLLRSPMLWKKNGRKVIPIAKAVWEPFAGSSFYYGNSFPNIMASAVDTYNNLLNSFIDKQYRALSPVNLVGMANGDVFDLEDQLLSSDRFISVPDVNQVKPMPISELSTGDVQLFQMIVNSVNESAPAMPNMIESKDMTAREAVIADEEMKKMKSLYGEMMTDLWKQRTELRIANINLNYPIPRKVIDDKGKEKVQSRIYTLDNAVIDEKTGEKGTLVIEFKKIKSIKDRKAAELDLAVLEESSKLEGVAMKKLYVDPDFLDNSKTFVSVIPESIYQKNLAKAQSLVMEKIESLQNFFPEAYVILKDDLFQEFAKSYDINASKAMTELQAINQAKEQMFNQQQMMPPQMTQMPQNAPQMPQNKQMAQ